MDIRTSESDARRTPATLSMRPTALLVLVAMLLVTHAARAQAPRGTEFWLAFIENYVFTARPPEPNEMLRIDIAAGDRDAQCRVEIPRAGWSADILVPAQSAGSVIVPVALAISFQTELVEGRGIRVTASEPVTVTAINHMTHGLGDASVVLPVESLGRDYVVATYDALRLDDIEFPSEFVVVAPEDSTTIEITPSVKTLGGQPAGVPFTIVLHRGESYQLQAYDNLSGTRVRSIGGTPCDRFAVFAGNLGAQVDSCNSIDHLYEQMLPIAALDREYFLVPFAMRPGGDIVDIIATEDSTIVRQSGGPAVVLDARQRLRTRLVSPARIFGTRPIAVMQYSRGRECDGAFEGDPHSIQLRPIGFASDLSFVAPGALTFNRHFVTVVVPTSMTASVQLDGVPIVGFTPFADLDLFSWAQTPVSAGPHRLRGSGIASAVLYGSGEAISYGLDFSAARTLEPTSRDIDVVTRCACGTVLLEAARGFDDYRWSNGDSTRVIAVTGTGNYSVVGSARGCSVASDPVRVVVDDTRSVISLAPADSVVREGDVLPLALHVRRSASTTATCRDALDLIALRFRSSMLTPIWTRDGDIVADSLDGPDRIVTLRVRSDTVLLDMRVAFGDTSAVSVLLDAFGSDSCMRTGGDTLARFTVAGCEVDGRRLFLSGEGAAIKSVRPLPVRGRAVIAFRTLEAGPTRLELIDRAGGRLAVLAEGFMRAGEHEAALDASGIATGVYVLRLQTPTREIVQKVVIE